MISVLAEEGGVALIKTLRKMINGSVSSTPLPRRVLFLARVNLLILTPSQATSTPQDSALASRAPKILHETGTLNFETQTAVEIERLYRAIGHQVRSMPLPPSLPPTQLTPTLLSSFLPSSLSLITAKSLHPPPSSLSQPTQETPPRPIPQPLLHHPPTRLLPPSPPPTSRNSLLPPSPQRHRYPV